MDDRSDSEVISSTTSLQGLLMPSFFVPRVGVSRFNGLFPRSRVLYSCPILPPNARLAGALTPDRACVDQMTTRHHHDATGAAGYGWCGAGRRVRVAAGAAGQTAGVLQAHGGRGGRGGGGGGGGRADVGLVGGGLAKGGRLRGLGRFFVSALVFREFALSRSWWRCWWWWRRRFCFNFALVMVGVLLFLVFCALESRVVFIG